uniref:Uncharacterized protein n=1 Tax=Oryza sativa subsp. japonica TaxID=39947 RepID=Q6ZDK7_ORYSJ|nr:hypothetical protein [Oryza sativa Japonica Group]
MALDGWIRDHGVDAILNSVPKWTWRWEEGSGRWQREGGGGRCRRQWAAAVGGEMAAVGGTLPSTNSGGRGGSGSGNAPQEAHKFLQYG